MPSYDYKYGIWAVTGGRSSALETIGRVAAGAVAKKLLHQVHGLDCLPACPSARWLCDSQKSLFVAKADSPSLHTAAAAAVGHPIAPHPPPAIPCLCPQVAGTGILACVNRMREVEAANIGQRVGGGARLWPSSRSCSGQPEKPRLPSAWAALF
jgi:hypothetical protein